MATLSLLPLLSSHWLSLFTCHSSAPQNSAWMSFWLTVAPSLHLRLHDLTFQSPDSKCMGGRTLLAKVGQQTIPGVICCGWGAFQGTMDILITQLGTQVLSECQWPWPRSFLPPAAPPSTSVKSMKPFP